MKNVLIGLLVVVVALLAFIATRPGHFRIERSATVAAPDSIVFAQLSNFHNWAAWSPWEELDPELKREITGPESGVGADYHWVGNDKVGEGRMTITEASAPERVGIRLEFIKPFAATNTTTFDLAPDAGGTRVTWAMEGDNNFMAKAMGLFMNMDKMVGADFEKGLAKLKTVSEAVPPAVPDAAPVATP